MSYGYVPGPPLPPPTDQRPRWFSRNWKWFIPTVILVPILAIALFVVRILSFVCGMITCSEPYHHAVAAVSHDARVTAQLGETGTPVLLASGHIGGPWRAG